MYVEKYKIKKYIKKEGIVETEQKVNFMIMIPQSLTQEVQKTHRMSFSPFHSITHVSEWRKEQKNAQFALSLTLLILLYLFYTSSLYALLPSPFFYFFYFITFEGIVRNKFFIYTHLVGIKIGGRERESREREKWERERKESERENKNERIYKE